jgi:hypothetical protein
MADQNTESRPSQDQPSQDTTGFPQLAKVVGHTDATYSGKLLVELLRPAGNSRDRGQVQQVRMISPFFGYTSTDYLGEEDDFNSTQKSYGMWMVPPDVGTIVVVIFINGDAKDGYWIGGVPAGDMNFMVPGLASTSFAVEDTKVTDKERVPVAEFNKTVNEQPGLDTTKIPKAAHPFEVVLDDQGLLEDDIRGITTSSARRETPSAVFGVSTPGTPIYQGGMKPDDIRKKINDGSITPGQAQVIGRVGGHTLVMDDGDIEGNNSLFRLRTAKGHQIMMNDSEDFFYIVHANGQTWLEFGVEGTVDVYATNSVNIRTKGDINFHADRDINMFAGRYMKMKSTEDFQIESGTFLAMQAQEDVTLYSKNTIGVKSDGTLTLNSNGGSWGAGGSLILQAGGIDLNGPAASKVTNPQPLTTTIMDDTEFDTSQGWIVKTDGLESIVSRAPTHEPYPYHNKGVDVEIEFEEGKPSPPPGAVAVPPGVEIQAE